MSVNRRVARLRFRWSVARQSTLPHDIDRLPSASRGPVFAAIQSGYTSIGLVDRLMEEDERLPLERLRKALVTRGLTVLRGASMGAPGSALRHRGMNGVGCVCLTSRYIELLSVRPPRRNSRNMPLHV
jgi:hypothetical protein